MELPMFRIRLAEFFRLCLRPVNGFGFPLQFHLELAKLKKTTYEFLGPDPLICNSGRTELLPDAPASVPMLRSVAL